MSYFVLFYATLQWKANKTTAVWVPMSSYKRCTALVRRLSAARRQRPDKAAWRIYSVDFDKGSVTLVEDGVGR